MREPESTRPALTFHALASVKGGVGKSTLAVGAALALEARGRAPFVIDADLTGTSLGDGLDLEAPELSVKDGVLNLEAKPSGYLPREETLRRWDGRRRADREPGNPVELPFLNDLLLLESSSPPPAQALAWRHRDRPSLRVLPSSPLRPDVENALAWLYDESQQSVWIARFAELLEAIARSGELTDVIVDLPPGLFGFTQQVLGLMAHLSQPAEEWPGDLIDLPSAAVWRLNPLLVSSDDHNDLFCAVETRLRLTRDLPELKMVVNRSSLARSELEASLRERFSPGAPVSSWGIGLVTLHGASLGRFFRGGSLNLDDSIRCELNRELRLDGASV